MTTKQKLNKAFKVPIDGRDANPYPHLINALTTEFTGTETLSVSTMLEAIRLASKAWDKRIDKYLE